MKKTTVRRCTVDLEIVMYMYVLNLWNSIDMSRLDRLSKYTCILPKQSQSEQAGRRDWCLRSMDTDYGHPMKV